MDEWWIDQGPWMHSALHTPVHTNHWLETFQWAWEPVGCQLKMPTTGLQHLFKKNSEILVRRVSLWHFNLLSSHPFLFNCKVTLQTNKCTMVKTSSSQPEQEKWVWSSFIASFSENCHYLLWLIVHWKSTFSRLPLSDLTWNLLSEKNLFPRNVYQRLKQKS